VDRAELEELHYIAHIDNVISIQERGLLSHNRMRKIRHVSVADPRMQDRRANRRVPGGRRLHDYANLYINARNKMLFVVLKRNPVEQICLLRVDPTAIDGTDAVVADCNVAADPTRPRFGPWPDGLALIDKDEVFAQFWTHEGDEIRSWRHGSRMCAEVLVPESIPPSALLGAYVVSDTVRRRLERIHPDLPLTVRPYVFFQ
jgi:hypothetical protein